MKPLNIFLRIQLPDLVVDGIGCCWALPIGKFQSAEDFFLSPAPNNSQ